jgi:sec-independent protein translocase protein TatA
MFGIGASELIIILVIVLLFFGGKKLPELSRSMGEALREIRKGLSDDAPSDTRSKSEKKK